MMPGDIVSWKVVPIGVVPYRLLLLMGWESGEVTLYDGDFCSVEETGASIPDFLVRSVTGATSKLPSRWREFTQTNWRNDTPLFTSKVRADSDGLWALLP
jgi:hypothetical protein